MKDPNEFVLEIISTPGVDYDIDDIVALQRFAKDVTDVRVIEAFKSTVFVSDMSIATVIDHIRSFIRI